MESDVPTVSRAKQIRNPWVVQSPLCRMPRVFHRPMVSLTVMGRSVRCSEIPISCIPDFRDTSGGSFLRGLGTLIMLPPLNPWSGREFRRLVPTGMAFIYLFPMVNMADWTPAETGSALSDALHIWSRWRGRSDVGPDRPDHDKGASARGRCRGSCRASATYLTATQARKTSGVDIRVGVSVWTRQWRKRRGDRTPFRSLSWDAPGQSSGLMRFRVFLRPTSTTFPGGLRQRRYPGDEPAAGGLNGSCLRGPWETAEQRERRRVRRQSILDFVLRMPVIGTEAGPDRPAQLDEYLASVDLERRIEGCRRRVTAELPYDTFPKGNACGLPDACPSDVRSAGPGVPRRIPPGRNLHRGSRDREQTSRIRSSASPMGIMTCRITGIDEKMKEDCAINRFLRAVRVFSQEDAGRCGGGRRLSTGSHDDRVRFGPGRR